MVEAKCACCCFLSTFMNCILQRCINSVSVAEMTLLMYKAYLTVITDKNFAFKL